MDHLQAAGIVNEALARVLGRSPSATERALMQAVAFLETNYGRASGQHAQWAAQGLYTWGNIEKAPNPDGSCDTADGWYPGSDAGNPRCFKLDTSDVAAAERYIRTMLNAGDPNSSDARTRAFAERSANIRSALSSGSPTNLANAMVTPKSVAYYEAAPATYAKGLANALTAIDAAVPRASAIAASVGKASPSAESPVPSEEPLDSESGTCSQSDVEIAAWKLAAIILNTCNEPLMSLVIDFQRAHGGLKVDGIYGARTKQALLATINPIPI